MTTLTTLFDTCVFIDHLRRGDKAATEALREARDQRGAGGVSVITVLELWAGVTDNGDARQHEVLLAGFQRIPVTHAITDRAKGLLFRFRGNKIGLWDAIIAATAAEYGLGIVTRNVGQFRLITHGMAIKVEPY